MKKIIGLIVFLIIWQLLVITTNSQIPPLFDIFNATIKNFPDLMMHLGYSLYRLLGGLIIALILGISIGFVLGLKPKYNKMFSPLVYALYPIPKAALVPVIIILLGIGEASRIFLIVLIVVFQVIINVKDALIALDSDIIEKGFILRLTKTQMLFKIYLPAILDPLFTTLRISIGTSIAILYLSETFATTKGLGYVISNNLGVNNSLMFSAILILSLVGIILFKITDYLQSKYCNFTR